MRKYQKSTDYRLGRGQNVLGAATDLGLKMPPPVAEAEARLKALQRRQRAQPTDAEARAATVALLRADPEADLSAAAVDELARDVTSNALAQAIDLLRHEVTVLALQYSTDLLADARKRIWAPAVEILVQAAAIEPSATLASLVQAGRTSEAEVLTHAAAAAETVSACYRFRAATCRGEDSGFPHRRWDNPQDLDLHALADLARLDYYLAGLRQGGVLTYLDLADLEQRSRTWAEEERARQAADAATARQKVLAARSVRDERARKLEERKKKSARRRARAA